MFTPSKKIVCNGNCRKLVNPNSIYVVVRGKEYCWLCFEREQIDGTINIQDLRPFQTTMEEELAEDRRAEALAEAMGRFHHHDHSPGL